MVSIAITTLIVIQNLVSSSNLVCSNYEQCKEQDITGYHSVACSGYKSCYNAPSIATTGGNLQCDGYFSCSESAISMPGGFADKVLCYGSNSCQLGNINAGSLYCGGSQSCQGNPAITVANQAFCGGYYSCTPKGTIQQTLLAAARLNCAGANACQAWGGSLQIVYSLVCSGYQSCKSDTIAASDPNAQVTSIMCSGDGSCMNTIISTANSLLLYGSMAAYGADIKGVSTIEAYGRTALYGATVDSDGVVGADSAGISMVVKLYGLGAGFNTDVICRSGDTCKLYCKGDACERTTFRCLDGATCFVSPKKCMKEGATEFNGIFCPIMTDSEPSITTNKRKVSYSLNMNDNNPEITSDANMYQCDSPQSCEANKFHASHNQALCYGANACIDIISNVPTKIDCFGDNSCGRAKIRSSGGGMSPDLNCNGKESCEMARYDATPQDVDTGAVSCNGYASCRSIEPISGGSAYGKKIRCNGESSCYRMKYILDNTSGFLRCDGYKSCQSADIFTGRYLGCYALASCQSALIRMTGNQDIECFGELSCFKANIDTDKAVFVHGMRAAEKATISASTLAVQSYLGITRATIDSGNRNIFVSLYGHFSGKGATLTCQQGSTCTLRCYGTACKGMNYVCLNTDLNNCKLEPSRCASGTDKVVNGIDCPKFGTSLSEKKDEEEEEEEEEEEVFYGEHLEPLGYKEVMEMEMEMDAELFGDISYAEKEEMIQGTSAQPAMFHIVMVVALFVIGFFGLIYAVLRAMKSSNKNEYQSLV